MLRKNESNKILEDCRARGDSVDELVEKYKLYESWIGDADEIYELRIRMAKKDIGKMVKLYLFTPSMNCLILAVTKYY